MVEPYRTEIVRMHRCRTVGMRAPRGTEPLVSPGADSFSLTSLTRSTSFKEARMRGQQLLGVLALGVAVACTGCFVHASARGEAEAPVTYASTPTLVAAGSGVWVVRGSSRATYYVSDNYWCYREGTWYRSTSWQGGWVVVEASIVPGVIVTRDHNKYVNFSGDANAETREAPKGDYVASNDKHPHGGPPGHDDTPGLGNQKKAAGLQPGEVGASADKDKKSEPAKAKSDPPKEAKPEPPKDPGPAAPAAPPAKAKADNGKKK
jgi:hypothetical protein